MGETCIIKNAKWFMTHEMLAIKAMIAVSAVVLIGVLVGLAHYGINLSTVFLVALPPRNRLCSRTRFVNI